VKADAVAVTRAKVAIFIVVICSVCCEVASNKLNCELFKVFFSLATGQSLLTHIFMDVSN